MLKKISLLAILPTLTFAFFIPFPMTVPVDASNSSKILNHNHIDNIETHTHIETHNLKVCPFIEYVDTVLCNSTEMSNKFKSENEIKVNEFKNNFENIKNKNNSLELSLELDPKDLCPLLDLIDKSFCKSSKYMKVSMNVTNTEKENIDPKDLCPLLELIETKICS